MKNSCTPHWCSNWDWLSDSRHGQCSSRKLGKKFSK